jgi:hypothetical protein
LSSAGSGNQWQAALRNGLYNGVGNVIANTITTVLDPPRELKESNNPVGDFVVSTGKSFLEGFVGGTTSGMITHDPSSVLGGILAATGTHAVLNGGINAPPKEVSADGIENSISFAFPTPSAAGPGIGAVAALDTIGYLAVKGMDWLTHVTGGDRPDNSSKPLERQIK